MKYNFNITADWGSVGVTNKETFVIFLESFQGENEFTNIEIENFNLIENTLKCKILNIENGKSLYLRDISISKLVKIPTYINSIIQINLSKNKLLKFNPKIPIPFNVKHLILSENQYLTTFNPYIPLHYGLEGLYLENCNISKFKPYHILPITLKEINLNNNKLSLVSYTIMEMWANLQPTFTKTCNVFLQNNINNANETNLKTILESKNCNVIT